MIRDFKADERYLGMINAVNFEGTHFPRTYFENQDSYEQFKICDFVTGGNGSRVTGSDCPSMGSRAGMTKQSLNDEET